MFSTNVIELKSYSSFYYFEKFDLFVELGPLLLQSFLVFRIVELQQQITEHLTPN